MFTVIFALARTSGWISHWLEMHSALTKSVVHVGYILATHNVILWLLKIVNGLYLSDFVIIKRIAWQSVFFSKPERLKFYFSLQ